MGAVNCQLKNIIERPKLLAFEAFARFAEGPISVKIRVKFNRMINGCPELKKAFKAFAISCQELANTITGFHSFSKPQE